MKNKKNIVGTVVFWTILVVVAVLALASVLTGKNTTSPPSLFGYSALWVETESMQPSISAQSYILVRKTDGRSLQPQDIITFVCRDSDSEVYGKLVTHRIVRVTDEGYKTKGDNPVCSEDRWTVTPDDVVAVYCKDLPVLTFFARLFSGWVGITCIGLIFVASMAFVYIPDLVKSMSSDEKEAKQAQIELLVQQEVERLKQQNDLSDGVVDATNEQNHK